MDSLLKIAAAAEVDTSQISSEAGVFSDSHLQDLYDSLIIQGAQSFDDAIDVGMLVEQTDIADIQDCEASEDLGLLGVVYDHLLSGSEHHLAAFTQYDNLVA